MNKETTARKKLGLGLALIAALGLSGCAGMSSQDQNTAVGAGIGALGGAALTGGSAVGVIGGAAVGGIIGREVNDDDRRYRR